MFSFYNCFLSWSLPSKSTLGMPKVKHFRGRKEVALLCDLIVRTPTSYKTKIVCFTSYLPLIPLYKFLYHIIIMLFISIDMYHMSKNTGKNVFLLLFSLSRNFIISSWPCFAAKSKGAFLFRSLGSRSTLLYNSKRNGNK